MGRAPKREIRFSARERKLILDHTFIYGEVAACIRAMPDGQSTAALSDDDLEELVGHVAAAANHCSDASLQRSLDRLYARLADALADVSPTRLAAHAKLAPGTRHTHRRIQKSEPLNARRQILCFKVKLRDVKPPIWRRIEVPAGYTF